MRRRSTFDAYLGDPIGSYTIGPTYLVWCWNVRLNGIAFWGDLDPKDAALLRQTRSQDSLLIDLRHIDCINPTVLGFVCNYLRSQLQAPRLPIPAAALLRPEGFAGFAVAGLCKVHDFSHRVEVFTDPQDALAWLGAVGDENVVAELDEILGNCAGLTAVLRALRAHLNRDPGSVNLATAAAALGISRRGLQRRLQEARTSFHAELNAAQIRFAKQLLVNTNHEIKRIAFEVGCSSSAAFCALFRRTEGQSPSSWRSQACSNVSELRNEV